MTYTVHATLRTEKDLVEILKWYADISPLRVEGFEEEFDAFVDKISKTPHRFFWIQKFDGRKAQMKRYPYHIYFQINEARQRVVIVGVIHKSRHPRVWSRRF